MAVYAIIKNNVVINLIEYENQPSNPPPGFDAGVIAIESNLAGVGFTYENGVFTPPQPFPSWVLVDNKWIPPIPYSDDPQKFMWDEQTKSWVKP